MSLADEVEVVCGTGGGMDLRSRIVALNISAFSLLSNSL